MASRPHNNPLPILVVDDEPDLRTLYELTLLREGYRVETAGSLAEAQNFLSQQRFELIITDMRLPDGLGTALLQQVREQRRPERCVVITAYGSAENAVESLKSGAFDYLTKPVDLKQFRSVIASAMQDSSKSTTESALGAGRDPTTAGVVHIKPPANEEASGPQALRQMVGESAVMRQVKERIIKVARSMAPVLIRGESGTGKELAACAVHANSHRAGGSIVAVNCGAIPESLLEAEFFGVKKGAFTGATQDRDGFFQAARGGTLFLDEIGDLPLAMQSKLLRAIQERRVRPIGSTIEEQLDVRIVSATHKDLAAEVQAGRFRQDLYYRLNVIEIHLPPLRERLADLPALCDALLTRIAAESGIAVPRMTQAMLDQLSLDPLRGNVRELENLLHRAVALSEDGLLGLLDEPDTSHDSDPWVSTRAAVLQPELAQRSSDIPQDLQSHLDQQEREILVRALQETGFNRTAAAARLGLSLRQIRYRIARLNIDAPQGGDIADEPT